MRTLSVPALALAALAATAHAGHGPAEGPPPHAVWPIPGGEAALNAATPGGLQRDGRGPKFSMKEVKEAGAPQVSEQPIPDLGPVTDATLPNAVTGRPEALLDPNATINVVIFYDQKCPCTGRIAPELNEFARWVKERGGRLVAVDAGISNSEKEQREHAAALPFPLLRDPSGKLALDYGADTTPEVFVIDAQRRIRYRGAFNSKPYTPLVEYASSATMAVLEGRQPHYTRTRTTGCSIRFCDEAVEELNRREAASAKQ
jgi:peroxiredoxin